MKVIKDRSKQGGNKYKRKFESKVNKISNTEIE